MPPDYPPLAPNAWLRWDTVLRTIGHHGDLGDVVEIGCGQGSFAVRLATRSRSYRAYEPDEASFEVASTRLAEIPGVEISNQPLPEVPTRQADLVCAFEVLEHLEDDAAALRTWREWIKPGGRLLISVPAHQSRFGPWDRAVGHYRRYGRSNLQTSLRAAGLEPDRISCYGFPLGYGLEWARDKLAPPVEGDCEEMTSKSGRLLQPSSRMSVITQLGTLPFRWLQRPFASGDRGTGWVALARRRQ